MRFASDLPSALRRLCAMPTITAAVVITASVVIAAATIVYTVVDTVLLRPLPYHDSAMLVSISHRSSASATGPMVVSAGGFQDYTRLPSVAAAAIENETGLNVTGVSHVERLTALRVSADWFRVYGTPPLKGRWLDAGDQVPGSDHVVVLLNGVWRRQFGGDTTIIGRTIQLNGDPYHVVGIMPPGFRSWFKPHSEIVVPLALTMTDVQGHYASAFYHFTARLAPGADVMGLRTELATLAPRVRVQHASEVPPGFRLEARALNALASADARPPLLMLSAALVLLVLIACANIGSLLLARATVRAPELALRRALGAERGDILRLSITDSLLLSTMGIVPGLALARVGLVALLARFPDIPRATEMSIGLSAAVFAAIAATVIGVLFGVVPAVWATRADEGTALRTGGRGRSAGRAERAMLGTLVSIEVALALSLLVVTGLLLESIARLRAVDPGFDARHAVAFNLSLPPAKYLSDASQRLFVRQLAARLSSLPHVRGVGTTSVIPFGGHWATASILAEGQARSATEDLPIGDLRVVAPGFFAALGIPVVRGRAFSEHDDASTPPVAIVDETFARRLLHGDAIGKRITIDPQPGQRDSVWMAVVGVVQHTAHEALDGPPRIQYYFPYAQRPSRNVVVAIGTTGDPTTALPLAREAIHDLDPDLPMSAVSSMGALVESSLAQRRLAVVLLACVAALATALTSLGVYGNLAFSVARRARDLGIRRALGGEPRSLMLGVVRESLSRVVPGLIVGLVIGGALAEAAKSQLYGTRALEPQVLIGATIVVVVVALAAAFIPARRSMRADPLVVLRSE